MPKREVIPMGGAAHYGAIAEYIASCDLLTRGIQVFRNMSPGGSVDLIALKKSGQMFRVEVKSAGVHQCGQKHRVNKQVLRRGAYDVLAVVNEVWQVFYFDSADTSINITDWNGSVAEVPSVGGINECH